MCIHGETFDRDFDDVGYEPETIDDSSYEEEVKYGLTNNDYD